MGLIVKYWKAQLERGDLPSPVWATVSLGGVQPEGYIIGWSVRRRAAQADLDKRGDASNWRLVRIQP